MIKYLKEIIILFIQLFMFYIYPLFCGPTDAMGMVFIILFITLILSIILFTTSNSGIKYLYPLIVALLFIPSIFIYYNISALIHSLWYFVDCLIGLVVGNILHLVIEKVSK